MVAKWRLSRQVLVSGHQSPLMLSGLEFRRVRWEEYREEQVDVVGHMQPGVGMPARAVEHYNSC
jgi:hypothetical protein